MTTRKTIAIIWARGNGSSLHRKSVYPILGRPLITYILDAARKSKVIDRLYVFTEDSEIAGITKEMGWQVIPRPERMVEYHHPQYDSEEIQRHQTRHILMDLGATQEEIKTGHLSEKIKGIFHFNCNYCLIRPETIRGMYDTLERKTHATRICLGLKVDPHLFILNSETGDPFPVWHVQGMDRRDYPPLYRLFPDFNFCLIDRLGKGRKAAQIIHKIKKDEALDVHALEDIALAEFYLQMRRKENTTFHPQKAALS